MLFSCQIDKDNDLIYTFIFEVTNALSLTTILILRNIMYWRKVQPLNYQQLIFGRCIQIQVI